MAIDPLASRYGKGGTVILQDADPEDVAAILAEVNFKHGALHTVMAEARKRTGLNLGQLTVLSPQNDPYRLDTPPNRANAKWFAEQFEMFVSGGDTIHLRGFHYVMLSHGGVYLPDGRPYINDSWLWMSDEASTSARMLGYVPFERINDERNAPPEVFPAEDWEVEVCLDEGGLIFLPGKKNVVPKFKCHLPTRQTYRIVLIGEKSSLKPILRPIAERIHAELLLPNGEASTTMIAGMARRAAEDGRPLIVLYFSDFDPSGWQMPITVSRKLQACRDLLYPDLDAQVYPVAMTLNQVVTLGLPSSALKEGELRAGKWMEAFGREQTEIDALAALRPDVLREIAEEAIIPFYDKNLESRTWKIQRDWQKESDELLEQNEAYQIAKANLDETYAKLEDLVHTFNEARDEALDVLKETEPPEIPDLPDSELPEEPDDPLFTTDDDYVTATLKLKARKGYSV